METKKLKLLTSASWDIDELNKILWFSAKGNRPYPSKFSKKDIN